MPKALRAAGLETWGGPVNALAWFTAGFIIVLIGVFIIMAAGIYYAYRQASQSNQTKAEVGGVVMIGPVPIIFGTSWKMAIIAIVLAIVLMVIAVALMFLARGLSVPPQQAAQAVAALLAP